MAKAKIQISNKDKLISGLNSYLRAAVAAVAAMSAMTVCLLLHPPAFSGRLG